MTNRKTPENLPSSGAAPPVPKFLFSCVSPIIVTPTNVAGKRTVQSGGRAETENGLNSKHRASSRSPKELVKRGGKKDYSSSSRKQDVNNGSYPPNIPKRENPEERNDNASKPKSTLKPQDPPMSKKSQSKALETKQCSPRTNSLVQEKKHISGPTSKSARKPALSGDANGVGAIKFLPSSRPDSSPQMKNARLSHRSGVSAGFTSAASQSGSWKFRDRRRSVAFAGPVALLTPPATPPYRQKAAGASSARRRPHTASPPQHRTDLPSPTLPAPPPGTQRPSPRKHATPSPPKGCAQVSQAGPPAAGPHTGGRVPEISVRVSSFPDGQRACANAPIFPTPPPSIHTALGITGSSGPANPSLRTARLTEAALEAVHGTKKDNSMDLKRAGETPVIFNGQVWEGAVPHGGMMSPLCSGGGTRGYGSDVDLSGVDECLESASINLQAPRPFPPSRRSPPPSNEDPHLKHVRRGAKQVWCGTSSAGDTLHRVQCLASPPINTVSHMGIAADAKSHMDSSQGENVESGGRESEGLKKEKPLKKRKEEKQREKEKGKEATKEDKKKKKKEKEKKGVVRRGMYKYDGGLWIILPPDWSGEDADIRARRPQRKCIATLLDAGWPLYAHHYYATAEAADATFRENTRLWGNMSTYVGVENRLGGIPPASSQPAARQQPAMSLSSRRASPPHLAVHDLEHNPTPLSGRCPGRWPYAQRMGIHHAALHADVSFLQALLQTPGGRADLSQRDSVGRTPLHYAIDAILYIPSPPARDQASLSGNNGSPHQHPTASGKGLSWINPPTHMEEFVVRVEQCVRILVAAGANLSATDRNGQTALHFAVSAAAPGLVNLLLREEGVRPELADVHGHTPLHVAAMSASPGTSACVSRLLQAEGVCVDARDALQRTPLHIAALEGLSCVVELLLDSGAQVDLVDCFACTPLHLSAVPAVCVPQLRGCGRLGRTLLAGAPRRESEIGDTRAKENNHVFMCHPDALRLKPKPSSKPIPVAPPRASKTFKGTDTETAETPAEGNSLWTRDSHKCVRLLLQHGADPLAETPLWRTPLHFAAGACFPHSSHSVAPPGSRLVSGSFIVPCVGGGEGPLAACMCNAGNDSCGKRTPRCGAPWHDTPRRGTTLAGGCVRVDEAFSASALAVAAARVPDPATVGPRVVETAAEAVQKGPMASRLRLDLSKSQSNSPDMVRPTASDEKCSGCDVGPSRSPTGREDSRLEPSSPDSDANSNPAESIRVKGTGRVLVVAAVPNRIIHEDQREDVPLPPTSNTVDPTLTQSSLATPPISSRGATFGSVTRPDSLARDEEKVFVGINLGAASALLGAPPSARALLRRDICGFTPLDIVRSTTEIEEEARGNLLAMMRTARLRSFGGHGGTGTDDARQPWTSFDEYVRMRGPREPEREAVSPPLLAGHGSRETHGSSEGQSPRESEVPGCSPTGVVVKEAVGPERLEKCQDVVQQMSVTERCWGKAQRR
eukprot:Rmarinus@m.12592